MISTKDVSIGRPRTSAPVTGPKSQLHVFRLESAARHDEIGIKRFHFGGAAAVDEAVNPQHAANIEIGGRGGAHFGMAVLDIEGRAFEAGSGGDAIDDVFKPPDW